MNPRYRITRNLQGDQPEPAIPLDECKLFFDQQPDFVYAEQYSVRSAETLMTIKGDFFMWQIGDAQIPFRYFDGSIYVAVSDEIIYQKMIEVAQGLNAIYIEG